MGRNFHEDFSHAKHVKVGSERSFGFVFAIVFTLLALLPLWHGKPLRVWAILTALGFLLVALTCPKLLAPLNKLWFKFGMLLNAIVQPIVMGAMFYLVFTPFGFLMRLCKGDFLNLKFKDPATTSYWVKREGKFTAESFKQQF